MIILGIDPGYAIVGYGIIEYSNNHFVTLEYGSIQTKAHTPKEDRLQTIFHQLDAIIKKYSPDVMAIEELFFNTNITTGIAVAEARGTILLCARENNVKIFEYTPLQVKQAVVGYGRATKKQVMELVRIILNMKSAIKLDDTADALAIAICHAHTGGSALRDYYNK